MNDRAHFKYIFRKPEHPSLPKNQKATIKIQSMFIAVLLILGNAADASCQTQSSQVVQEQQRSVVVSQSQNTIQVPVENLNRMHGTQEFHSVPGYQYPTVPNDGTGYITVYKQVTKQVRVFNQFTGQYETRTYMQAVPVQVPRSGKTNLSPPNRVITVPVPHHSTHSITVLNRFDVEVTFDVGGRTKKIPAGGQTQFNVKEGQSYSYSLPARQVGRDQWNGGGTATGVITQSRVITIGNSNSQQPPQGPAIVGGQFNIKFINTNSGEVSLTVYDLADNPVANTMIPGGGTYHALAKAGYTYVQGGPVVYRNGTAVSGTMRGQISNSKTTIRLGN